MPVQHIVLFQFKADASPEVVQTLVASMLKLKDTCIRPDTGKPYIQSLTGGKDHSPEGLQNGCQYGFVVVFESIEDRDFYAEKDEVHAAFKKAAAPNSEKVIVVDYSF